MEKMFPIFGWLGVIVIGLLVVCLALFNVFSAKTLFISIGIVVVFGGFVMTLRKMDKIF
jgi:hypothetical protein